ncbi:hypothetical protein BDF14DRAFT_1878475 [Spinellus fusiger]|nr:hypothetical protein BDF14DRAFT_1878475 [Spinellus fusiger]
MEMESYPHEFHSDNELPFDMLPSATADSMQTYDNISANIYLGSATGKSIASESMPCECKFDPHVDDPSEACGDDHHCINRLMFMECMEDDCPCGRFCRNRRFQLRQYARVDVIQTDKKGFGLRALTDLPTNAFIMEYIGEVIPNSEFIRRTRDYEKEGLKHYYFMTLKTDEIIDATKKGCLARFINHSCEPNCVTQKWVVGKTMRIGIFTNEPVRAGEELTFDYKFERYGAVAQKCYCGKPTCKGFIGASDKKNDEMEESEMSPSEEELAYDSEGYYGIASKKKSRRKYKRPSLEPLHDPNEVQAFVKRMLDSVGKAHLVNKLLRRLELTNPDSSRGKDVLRQFVRFHGLKMLKFWLGEWKSDEEIVKKVLHVLDQLPLANRNGLEDCKMLDVVRRLMHHEQEEIHALAQELMEKWENLKSIYRIPKRLYVEPQSSHEETFEQGTVEPKEEVYPYDPSMLRVQRNRCHSTREFFDPDDDYFEYLTMDASSEDIHWKTQYPPTPAIPTGPRAMVDYSGGSRGYGRPLESIMPLQDLARHTHYDMTEESTAMDDTPYDPALRYADTDSRSIEPMVSETATPQSKTMYYDTPHVVSSKMHIVSTQSPVAASKLPLNWRMATCEDGTVYYYSKITGKSQWDFPEERVSSIEGVDQAQLTGLVEKAILDAQRKKNTTNESSPASRTELSPQHTSSNTDARPKIQMGGSHADEGELKKEVGKVVTKYLSTRQSGLWHGDKHLFKELARKITHHIVDRESSSSRKFQGMDTSRRSKIEKFIDIHGQSFSARISRKKKLLAGSPLSHFVEDKTDSRATSVSLDTQHAEEEEEEEAVYTPDQLIKEPPLKSVSVNEPKPAWTPERALNPHSESALSTPLGQTFHVDVSSEVAPMRNDVSRSASYRVDDYYYYHRRSRDESPYSRERSYRPHDLGNDRYHPDYPRSASSFRSSGNYYYSSYYRYPLSPPPYRLHRYYGSRQSPPYYRSSATSSRRNSPDEDFERRRWD